MNAIGAYTPETRELDAVAMARGRVVVETRDVAMAEAGDVLLAIREGAIGRGPHRGRPPRGGAGPPGAALDVRHHDLQVGGDGVRGPRDRARGGGRPMTSTADVVVVGGGVVGAERRVPPGGGRRRARRPLGTSRRRRHRIHRRVRRRVPPPVLQPRQHRALARQRPDDPGIHRGARAAARRRAGRLPLPGAGRTSGASSGRGPSSSGRSASIRSCSRRRRPRRIAPGIAIDDVVGATFCAEDGIADPSGLTQGYATLARRAGADLRLGVEALAIETDRGTVTGVRTADGIDRHARRRERRRTVGGSARGDGRRAPSAGTDPAHGRHDRDRSPAPRRGARS